jgi:hypothetical protein
MKLLKKLFLTIGVLSLLLIGFTLYGIYEMDGLVKAAIEKYGSEAVKAQVSVASVSVDLKKAQVTLKKLSVANPEGFKEKNAFYAGEVVIDLDEKHLNTSKIIVQKVSIAAPTVTYEFSSKGDNLGVLQNNAISYAKQISESVGAESSKSSEKSKIKILIKDVYLSDVSLLLRDNRLFDASIKLPLPNIHMTKVGNAEDGSDPSEVAGQVMNSLFGSTKKVVTESAPAALEQAGVQLKDAQTVVKDTGNKLFKEIKNLFSN